MFDAAHDEALPAQTPPDPMIEVAERHLRLLAEVAELAMDAARASSALVVATAEAAAKLVAEKDGAWACEADKAYAVRGSREAADAFTRITRALRLTLTLETAAAERLRDLRAGIVPARQDRAERGAARPGAALDLSREKVGERVADVIAEAAADDGDITPALDLACDLRERLTETDRFGPLLNRPLIEVVGLICADIGVSPDWSRWNDEGSSPDERTPRYDWPPPPSWGRCLAEGQTEGGAATNIPPGQSPSRPPAVLPP
ncbi:MAG: hypothetical protein JWO83_3556 [Caulobacteraceae bacterium]|nr:hypothetical protein [Caulobacteraceae bacterium]